MIDWRNPIDWRVGPLDLWTLVDQHPDCEQLLDYMDRVRVAQEVGGPDIPDWLALDARRAQIKKRVSYDLYRAANHLLDMSGMVVCGPREKGLLEKAHFWHVVVPSCPPGDGVNEFLS